MKIPRASRVPHLQILGHGFLVLLLFTLLSCDAPHGSRVVVGCKNFTEQVLLGELLAQQIESHGEKVDRRFYLAGSYIAHQALLSGRIDAYVEYTGTALSSILKQPVDHDPGRVLATITRLYAPLGVTVEPSLGFQNTFAMVMRQQDAPGIQTLSELAPIAPKLRLGVGYEFEDRPDGLHGMERRLPPPLRRRTPHHGPRPPLPFYCL